MPKHEDILSEERSQSVIVEFSEGKLNETNVSDTELSFLALVLVESGSISRGLVPKLLSLLETQPMPKAGILAILYFLVK